MSTGPFDTLLVANRGEIACRVIRSARDLGLRTVAVYSDADAGAPHVALADLAVRLGPGPAAESYLDAERILAAAAQAGAQAIHPGYGFLSESAAFARACTEAGLIFVGPSAESVAAMGDKAAAKVRMRAAGVPVVPGYDGEEQADAAFAQAAEGIGYPVLVKASAGGGGRGMRRVDRAEDLPEALARARNEARSAFGSEHLILEKLVEGGRHVEVQVLADTQGTCLHLFERDCSTQRRHQKVIEEAPSPAVSPELRARMGQAAVRAAEAVAYTGAGTVELLLDDSGAFYFLEMNTRLQVEHPVTELVTGLDLVALQLRVAMGEPLGLRQEDLSLRGHAIEARLYAEDPADGDRPQTGTVVAFRAPEGAGLRTDHGLVDGLEVSPFYDSMLAKVMAWGPDRHTARRRLERALEETVLLGLRTNRHFLVEVLRSEAFRQGEVRTDFLAREGEPLRQPWARAEDVVREAAALWLQAVAGAGERTGFRNSHAEHGPLFLEVGGEVHEVRCSARGRTVHFAESSGGGSITLLARDDTTHRLRYTWPDGRTLDRTVHATVDGDTLWLQVGGWQGAVRLHVPRPDAEDTVANGQISAPGAGKVLSVLVSADQPVAAGDPLAVLEAMKLETTLRAPVAGTVQAVRVTAGDLVKTGQILFVLEPSTPQEDRS